MVGLEDVFCADRCRLCGVAGLPVCLSCVSSLKRSPQPVVTGGTARLLSALSYEGPARGLVLALKLGGRRHAAGPLVEAMVDLAHRAGLEADVVTWVPGRRRDIRRRGFDHADVLAHGLATRLGLPCRPLLARTGTTRDQAGLGRSERWVNAAGSFVACRWDGPVVVADDLVTSGATADAAASALRLAGSPGIEILTACRADRAGSGTVGRGGSLSGASA